MILRILGPLVGALLGLLIFSYVLGDNPLYRIGVHIFAGVMIGYSVGIVIRDVLLGKALAGLLSDPATTVIPVGLGLLLLFKGLPRETFVGNASAGYLVGVGTAVALGGALLGTLVPQVRATARTMSATALASHPLGLLDGVTLVIGTVCTLLAFTFTTSDRVSGAFGWQQIVGTAASVGRVFLIFALGVAFAAVLTASLSIFVGQAQTFLDLALRALGLGL